MKSSLGSVLAVALLLSGWQAGLAQQEPISAAVAGQFNSLNRQLSLVQSIMTELSRSLTQAVDSGARAINTNTETLASTFTPIVNQLSSLQQALNTVASQAQRIIDSGSRVITGQPLATDVDPSVAGAASKASVTESKNETATQSLLPTPTDFFVRTVEVASRQLAQVAAQLRRRMSSVITTGARTLAVNQLNPTDSVLEVMEDYVRQVSEIQKSLRTANNELNRLLEKGVFGEGSSRRRMKRADALVVTGMQKAATELTREIGQIGGTLARIAGGISGVRIPGMDGDGTRGTDSSTAAFQGLNPVGVISRGFGNIASSLSRILPSSSGRR